MKKAVRLFLVLTCLVIGCTCSFSISGESKIIQADDGYQLLTWNTKMEPDIFKGQTPKAILFFIQNSDYTTVTSRLGALAGAVFMNIPVILLERRGIDEKQKADLDTCYKYHTKEIQIKDYLKVIDEYLKGINPKIPILLVGEGEGGDVAAAVAKNEKRITQLILLDSGGGWTQAEEIKFLVSKKRYFNPDITPDELDSIFEDIKTHQDSLTLWGGLPYRRWSSYLWARPADDLATLNIPIFLGHGDKDNSVPVESARALKEKFDELKKSNLTYKEYKDANRLFITMKKDILIMPLVEVDILKWFQEVKIITEAERETFENRVKKAHPEYFTK